MRCCYYQILLREDSSYTSRGYDRYMDENMIISVLLYKEENVSFIYRVDDEEEDEE